LGDGGITVPASRPGVRLNNDVTLIMSAPRGAFVLAARDSLDFRLGLLAFR
jgi:hypothetical protein